MNKFCGMGRLTRDPDIRYTQGENSMVIARYTLAIDRRRKKEGEQNADFISCVAFGKSAEFAEKYFHKGIKITVSGRIQTGHYTHKDGYEVYTTDLVIEEQEFAESKNAPSGDGQGSTGGGGGAGNQITGEDMGDGFMSIPDGIDEELPFN